MNDNLGDIIRLVIAIALIIVGVTLILAFGIFAMRLVFPDLVSSYGDAIKLSIQIVLGLSLPLTMVYVGYWMLK